jgi:hypothetical protein
MNPMPVEDEKLLTEYIIESASPPWSNIVVEV